MGLLVDGAWRDVDMRVQDGHFVRKPTVFHNYITADGRAGPTGKDGFPAEAGRYHLYVSLACPWAHRTLIFRKLKKLDAVISVSVTIAHLGNKGWEFGTEPGATLDAVNGKSTVADIYTLADPHYNGRASVPVLWDKKQRTIVNNESSEIIRMLNSAFDAFTDVRTDYYPPALRSEIDRINDVVYNTVNNGVYRAGFATRQAAYEEAAKAVFATLDQLEALLARQRYLVGTQITEADWRLFTTLVRFDAVYYSHFKCNVRRIIDYANLWNYVRDLYQVPGVAETVSLDHIKRHYYGSHRNVNPTGIVPIGPDLDFTAPHDRGRFLVGA
ncbi:MAG TPA: glutathione S-transferase family protein [Xanthobacteraceae bacterium]|nr:glutathione S-transferase family protein [Xanthobacteraceae bacterium]